MFYLLFLVCVLIPIVIIISNGVMIYDYYKDKFINKIHKITYQNTIQNMEQKRILQELQIVNVNNKLRGCDVGILKGMLPGCQNVLDCSNAIFNEMKLQNKDKDMNMNMNMSGVLMNGVKYESQ